mmetsp:Transcript_77713/g.171649  ORF Transcript_77713/g.171649 Transcript_77713/m.171649 type:complete len:88 (-) Transcript_77713:73-336(-)
MASYESCFQRSKFNRRVTGGPSQRDIPRASEERHKGIRGSVEVQQDLGAAPSLAATMTSSGGERNMFLEAQRCRETLRIRCRLGSCP